MMKKLVLMLCVLIGLSAIAGIREVEGYSSDTPYMQFSHVEETNFGNYTDSLRADQNWLGAQMITLSIDSECDVWLSNYVSSWYWPKPLDALDGNVFDMSAGNYGAFEVNGTGSWVGQGQTTTVTYFDDLTGAENQTEAYLLGHFKGGEDIAVWMTTLPEDGGEKVDMQQYVADVNHSTTLASRVDGTHDLAGNVRINFGLTNYKGREFVAFGVSQTSPPISGQPLPGTILASVIALGTIGAAKKFKKRS